MKPLIVSLSGTRGIIGENLHPSIAMDMAIAFGTYAQKGPVIVGTDTRTSYQMLKSAVISGLLSVGVDVIDIGVVPTPTVQQMISHYHATGGIVITASHNPIMWNGIKLMSSDASFLNDQQYAEYSRLYETVHQLLLAPYDRMGVLTVDDSALDCHIDRILSVIDPTDIQESHLKVCIDPNNGAGCLANQKLFEKLNIQAKMINAQPNGLFAHNPEPSKQNLDQIILEMQSGAYDIGFVQDADADRLVILDETGHFIGEDYSLAFSMDYILSELTDADKKIVVNLSTSQVIRFLAQKYQAQIFYTKIGETNVTQGIRSHHAQVGGEGNGGVIYPAVGWGRDSLVGIVIALKHLAKRKKKVSEIVSEYPKFVMLREKIEVNSRAEVDQLLKLAADVYQSGEKNTEDGIKISFKDSWVHIRPSNTEPIVRIFIEAPTQEQARQLFELTKGFGGL